jgi:hypothetical protein
MIVMKSELIKAARLCYHHSNFFLSLIRLINNRTINLGIWVEFILFKCIQKKTPHHLVNTNSLTIHLQCCARLKKSLAMSDPHYTIKQISSVFSKAARDRRRNIISNKRKKQSSDDLNFLVQYHHYIIIGFC